MDPSDIGKIIQKLVRASILVREGDRFYLIKDYDKWAVDNPVDKSVDNFRGVGKSPTVPWGNPPRFVGKSPTDINKVVKDRSKDIFKTTAPKAGRGVNYVHFLTKTFLNVQEEKIKEKPSTSHGAAGSIFKKLLAHHPAETILQRMKNWFESEDPFIRRTSWKVFQFHAFFNTLRDGPINRENKDWSKEREEKYQKERKRREELNDRADAILGGRNFTRK